MKIDSKELMAFHAIVKHGSISNASKHLNLTQSALTQRLKKLENDLDMAIFYREGKKLILNEFGEKLLAYANQIEMLENEFFGQILSKNEAINGPIKIGTYSSIMRSIILPKISPILTDFPGIKFDIQTHEIGELNGLLKSQKCDLIFLDFYLEKTQLNSFVLSEEEYVLISPKTPQKGHENTFIDHGTFDNITESFFIYNNQRKQLKNINRKYINDVYGIIDAVELGLGHAIMSKHLVENNKNIKISTKYKSLIRPIIGYYVNQSFYSKAFLKILSGFQGIN